MRRVLLLIVAVFIAALSVALVRIAASQTPSVPDTPAYRVIYSNDAGKVRDRLSEVADQGYTLVAETRCPSEFGVLLKHDNAPPPRYRLIETRRFSTFARELSDAGSQGFRLIPGTAVFFNVGNGDNWVAILAQQEPPAQFVYTDVKATNEAIKEWAAAGNSAAKPVAILSNDRLIFEQVSGAAASSQTTEYRIVGTSRTSTFEKEIVEAAADGFRVHATGRLIAVLGRQSGVTAAPLEYKLIAMIRAPTAERELNEAGAQGFRIALTPECTASEGMFLLSRTPGTSERFEYKLAKLKEKTANDILTRAEGDGFSLAVLFNENVILERRQK